MRVESEYKHEKVEFLKNCSRVMSVRVRADDRLVFFSLEGSSSFSAAPIFFYPLTLGSSVSETVRDENVFSYILRSVSLGLDKSGSKIRLRLEKQRMVAVVPEDARPTARIGQSRAYM